MCAANHSFRVATSRRDFLKRSAAGVAALASIPVARGAHAAGEETIRIGMIGCGGRCSGAAAQSMKAGPYVKLVAMNDEIVATYDVLTLVAKTWPMPEVDEAN